MLPAGGVPKPRGRPRLGHRWDSTIGKWVPDGGVSRFTHSSFTSRTLKQQTVCIVCQRWFCKIKNPDPKSRFYNTLEKPLCYFLWLGDRADTPEAQAEYLAAPYKGEGGLTCGWRKPNNAACGRCADAARLRPKASGVPSRPKASCPACRGQKRAHTCGLRRAVTRAPRRFPPRSDPNPPAGWELRTCGGSCDGCSSWTGWYVGNLSKSEQHKACGKRATVVIASVIP